MDVHAARGNERMLRRVIALLVALAVLAERAAGRSLAVRWFVLWILRRAETAAADFVFEETGSPPPALQGVTTVGNAPADALRLAARFHALASALGALLPIDHPFHHRPAWRGSTSGHAATCICRHPHGWTPRPFDTS